MPKIVHDASSDKLPTKRHIDYDSGPTLDSNEAFDRFVAEYLQPHGKSLEINSLEKYAMRWTKMRLVYAYVGVLRAAVINNLAGWRDERYEIVSKKLRYTAHRRSCIESLEQIEKTFKTRGR